MNEIERAIAYWEEFEREIDEMPHSDVLEAQREPVKTALTVLRAELDREKNEPLTWDERINQMTVEEKAERLDQMGVCWHGLHRADSEHCGMRTCKQCWIERLNSPYAEGETE